MSHPCCPTPGVWPQLSAGPLGAPLDTFAHPLLDQGEARWTAKARVRLLAALSRGLQRHARTATDLNEPRVEALLQDRSRRDPTHRHDRPVMRRRLGQRRAQGVMPLPVVETHAGACDRLACAVQPA